MPGTRARIGRPRRQAARPSVNPRIERQHSDGIEAIVDTVVSFVREHESLGRARRLPRRLRRKLLLPVADHVRGPRSWPASPRCWPRAASRPAILLPAIIAAAARRHARLCRLLLDRPLLQGQRSTRSGPSRTRPHLIDARRASSSRSTAPSASSSATSSAPCAPSSPSSPACSACASSRSRSPTSRAPSSGPPASSRPPSISSPSRTSIMAFLAGHEAIVAVALFAARRRQRHSPPALLRADADPVRRRRRAAHLRRRQLSCRSGSPARRARSSATSTPISRGKRYQGNLQGRLAVHRHRRRSHTGARAFMIERWRGEHSREQVARLQSRPRAADGRRQRRAARCRSSAASAALGAHLVGGAARCRRSRSAALSPDGSGLRENGEARVVAERPLSVEPPRRVASASALSSASSPARGSTENFASHARSPCGTSPAARLCSPKSTMCSDPPGATAAKRLSERLPPRRDHRQRVGDEDAVERRARRTAPRP